MLFTGPNQSAQHSGLGVEGVVVDAAGGAPFTTIGQAIGYFNAHNTAGRRCIWVMPGTYAESFTVPAGPFSIIGVGQVEITGTVTLTDDADEYLLENLQITSAAAGTCIDADMGGLGATGAVRLRNVRLVTSAAGTGLLAAACNVFIEGGLRVSCPASTGISLTAGDAAAERTRLVADRVHILGAAPVDGIFTADGAAAGDETVEVRIAHLLSEVSASGNLIDWNTTGAHAAGIYNGFDINWLELRPAAADGDGVGGTVVDRIEYIDTGADADPEHHIGTISGRIDNGLIIDHNGGRLIIDQLDLPDDGTGRDTFQIARLGGGDLTLLGGECSGGEAPGGGAAGGGLFAFDAAGSDLTVKNFRITALEDGGRFLDSGAALTDATVVLFEDCFLSGDSAAGAEDELFECLGAGASVPTFTLRRCRVEALTAVSTGSTAISLLNANLTLEDTTIQQVETTLACIDFGASTIGSALEWIGHCVLDSFATVNGRALVLVDDAQNVLVENGLLDIVRCAVANQFGVNLAGGAFTTTNTGPLMVNRVGPRIVAQGYQATVTAAAHFFGDAGTGHPSSYPGVHIVDEVGMSYVGNGAAANVDTVDMILFNRTTGLNSGAAVQFPDSTVATQLHVELALTAPVLVGPGQALALESDAVGANAPTSATAYVS